MSVSALQACGDSHRVPNGDDALAWLRERFAGARNSDAPLHIQGAGSHRPAAQADGIVSLAGYTGIVEYDPSDLVVTVRSGTPLSFLERTLAVQGQMLGFEPVVGASNTVGGAVALGWSGPRRPYAGALRDHLIGVRMVDGKGRELRFGGRVVKNVAGFDAARLAGGSQGMLGAILDVTLRVMPRPETERTIVLRCSPAHALRAMNEAGQGPGPLSASAYFDGCLYQRYSGSRHSVERLLGSFVGEYSEVAEASAFWRGVVAQTDPFFQPRPDQVLWRVSVRPDAPLHPSTGAIDWAGGLRWIWMPPANQTLREWARQHSGHAAPWLPGAGHAARAVPDSLISLNHSLADVFDPYRIFDRSALQPSAQENTPCV